VSPVIGVILMVAATIVIAAVVIGMLGGFGAPKAQYLVSASASERTVNESGSNVATVYVTYAGGPDADQVSTITALIDGFPFDNDFTADPAVGETATTTTNVQPGANNDHIVVTAKFNDNTYQVILDTFV